LEIVLRNRDAPRRGAGMQGGHLRSIAAQCELKSLGGGFARKVVLCGPKAAHQENYVDAPQRCANGVDQVFTAVADDGLERDQDTDLVQLEGEVKRIGVLSMRSEHLRADGDNF